jgi:poly-gamma-glutamate capsule biosynthesis protein CapA/YwtB (metallophosphatase superfamily)
VTCDRPPAGWRWEQIWGTSGSILRSGAVSHSRAAHAPPWRADRANDVLQASGYAARVQAVTTRRRRSLGRPLIALLTLTVIVAACDSGNAKAPSNGTAPSGSGNAGAVVGATKQPAAIAGASSTPGSRTAQGLTAGGGSTASTATTSGASTSAPAPAAAPPTTTPLAVVTGFDNYKLNSLTTSALVARLTAKSALVPCGAEAGIAAALKTTSAGWAPCVAATRLTASLPRASTKIGLLPPGLVGPGVKVVPLGGADLFGEGPQRSKAYPLVIPTPKGWTADQAGYDVNDVRVMLTTGVNCADRGVSRQTNTFHKGWEWLLNAGTARYTGTHWDPRLGWNVVDAVRTGNLGAIKALIKNADIATSDFECAMAHNFVQHDNGTQFSVDPKVAALMKEAGFDVATIGSDHMTNWGFTGLFDTINYFKKAGIQTVGAGANLAAALKPAVVDVRGLKFAFYAVNAAGGSVPATATGPGTARLTANNIKNASAAARNVGDIVIAMPQWSTSEYRAGFLDSQIAWRNEMYADGTDHVIGADFHWAGALSITPGGVSGNHLTIASEGNFWFGQDWSRQTEEAYMTLITFVGKRLAQVRLIPTVVLDNAQPNLTNPATDGQFVLKQALSVSTIQPK